MNQIRDRYGAISQAFHWITAILVLVAFIYGPGGAETRIYSSVRDFDRQLHETLGVTIFVLVTVRLFWRMVDRQPEPPEISRWVGLAAKIVQRLLYVLLFALPITAVTGAWLEAHPLTLLGGLEIAPLLSPAHDTGVKIATLHGWLGDTIMWFAGIHAAAAIFHHVVLRDDVFLSMLPRWFPLRRRGA